MGKEGSFRGVRSGFSFSPHLLLRLLLSCSSSLSSFAFDNSFPVLLSHSALPSFLLSLVLSNGRGGANSTD